MRWAAAISAALTLAAMGGVTSAQEVLPPAAEPKPIEARPIEARPIQVTPEVVAGVRRAADRGDPAAQITLGFFFEGGQGVAASFDDAAFWYEKAAEAGAPRAAQLLGLLNGRSDWPRAKPVIGLGWLDTAIALGRTEAQPARDRLALRLSPAERQVAETFARGKIAEIKARSGRAGP